MRIMPESERRMDWLDAPRGVAATVVAGTAGIGRLPDGLSAHPVSTLTANATMLQQLLGAPPVPGVLWTLSYEMVFYLLVSVLFVWGAHRRSAFFAGGFAAIG